MRWLFLCLVLASCSTKNGWHESEISSSTRLIVADKGPLKLEIISSDDGVESFLTLNFGSAKIFEKNLSRVRYEVGEMCFDTTAFRFKGGQRLKLLSDQLFQIASKFEPNQLLTIRLYGYKLCVQVSTILETYKHIRGKYEQTDQTAKDDNDRSRYRRDQRDQKI